MNAADTEGAMELMALVSNADTVRAARVLELLETLAPDPKGAVELLTGIVNATAVVLRHALTKQAGYRADDHLGFAGLSGTRGDPAAWRAMQMLTAAYNGDLNDAIDHALVASRNGDDMGALMVQVLLLWHQVSHLAKDVA